jgi:hypothetical protein
MFEIYLPAVVKRHASSICRRSVRLLKVASRRELARSIEKLSFCVCVWSKDGHSAESVDPLLTEMEQSRVATQTLVVSSVRRQTGLARTLIFHEAVPAEGLPHPIQPDSTHFG